MISGLPQAPPATKVIKSTTGGGGGSPPTQEVRYICRAALFACALMVFNFFSAFIVENSVKSLTPKITS
jgi:hypothetical protein